MGVFSLGVTSGAKLREQGCGLGHSVLFSKGGTIFCEV